MPDTLLSGPAGAGKTAEAKRHNRRLRRASRGAGLPKPLRGPAAPGAAGLTGAIHHGNHVTNSPIPMVEYIRRAAITAARDREIEVVLTNSDS